MLQCARTQKTRRSTGRRYKLKKITPLFAAALVAATLTTAATDASAQWRGPGWGARGPGWGWRGPAWGWRRPGWGWRGPGWGAAAAAGVVGGAIIAGAILAARPPGYVIYPGYAEPLYAPTCYWASQPVLDPAGRVVGYTGQPVQICPGYVAGPPPAYAGPPPPPPPYGGPPPADYDGPPPPAYGGPPPRASAGPPPPVRAPATVRSVSHDRGQVTLQGAPKPAPQNPPNGQVNLQSGRKPAPQSTSDQPSGPPSSGLQSDRPQAAPPAVEPLPAGGPPAPSSPRTETRPPVQGTPTASAPQKDSRPTASVEAKPPGSPPTTRATKPSTGSTSLPPPQSFE